MRFDLTDTQTHRHKDRPKYSNPPAHARRVKNEPTLEETDLVVEEMLEANTADTYVSESDDDRDSWCFGVMDADEEFLTLMELVFWI